MDPIQPITEQFLHAASAEQLIVYLDAHGYTIKPDTPLFVLRAVALARFKTDNTRASKRVSSRKEYTT